MHIVFQIIWGLFIGFMLFLSIQLSFTRHGPVNNIEFNAVLAILANKLIGMIGIMGCIIASILLFK